MMIKLNNNNKKAMTCAIQKCYKTSNLLHISGEKTRVGVRIRVNLRYTNAQQGILVSITLL